MRTLVTFILRLWVDPEAEKPGWEGRIEEVASAERAHVRGPEELARFVEVQTTNPRPDGFRKPVRSQTEQEERTEAMNEWAS